MQKITEIFLKKERTYSLEFFTPKTIEGQTQIFDRAKILLNLGIDFFSVTYGAGGSTRLFTTEIVDQLQQRFKIPTMHHLTCIGHHPEELIQMIHDMKKKNICNILALHGDPPKNIPDWRPPTESFSYAYQLCELIRKQGKNNFSVGVAGFPEGHIRCPDREADARYLKQKLDAGGDFVITQLFFKNKDYFDYLTRLKKIGVQARVIPGILPITNYENLVNFCQLCGTSIPAEIHTRFQPLKDDPAATLRAGIEFAIQQCRDLLKQGAPGLHFYTLNKVEPTREILSRLMPLFP